MNRQYIPCLCIFVTYTLGETQMSVLFISQFIPAENKHIDAIIPQGKDSFSFLYPQRKKINKYI